MPVDQKDATSLVVWKKRELVVCTAPHKPGEQELLRAIAGSMAACGHSLPVAA